MSAAVAGEPRLIHTVPGRVRVYMPGLAELGPRTVEGRLRDLPGVRRAAANPLTGTILIYFDPQASSDEALLSSIRALEQDRETEWNTPTAGERVRETL